MPKYPIDLHSHTTASDGTHTPTELVQRAIDYGLTTLGIADHDTVDGLAEAHMAASQGGLQIVPAIEFSTRHEPEKNYIGIHLLGYFIDPTHPALVEMLERVKQGRVDQKIRQIELLQSFGYEITVEEVFAKVKGVPGRPHIAAVLRERYPERFQDTQQIFDEYLGSQAKAHVGRQFGLTVAEAITLTKEAGGLPVFAHPGVYADIDAVAAVRQAHAEGVEGVEVTYPYKQSHRPADGKHWVSLIDKLADELGLLKTGGTDFHGRSHEIVDLGDSGLTSEQFQRLQQGWRERRG